MAANIAVVGLFPGKAVLVIDGGAPKTVSVGEVFQGVKLITVEHDAATVESDGKRIRVELGGQPITAFESHDDEANGQTVSLVADGSGHFSTIGSINGATVKFFVDTGASDVAMGPEVAKQAGIDYHSGETGYASTANGVVQVWHVKLARVKVGDVTLRDVDGMVMQLEMPYVLLGMSFLNRLEMHRDGSTMTLRRRY